MIRLALGRKERGKTTLAVHMAEKVGRLVAFDPRGMIRRPGAVIVRDAESFRAYMAALSDGEIRALVYVPRDDLDLAFTVFAAEVRRWIDTMPDRALAVLVDEITFVTILTPDFEWALKCCRADTIHFFLTCHRPADVPVVIRSITNYWYLFQAYQEHDLDVIEKRCSPATAAAVQTLDGSQMVCWDDDHARLIEYRDPSAWYVNLRPGPPLPPPIDVDPV
ncbi:MAG: hypothetical protein A3E78_04315 [Alphaproteobacteria bacterium RIFCSPHIGHO2_12_FULL_63_12]|nr:MAG: hypothetical protein A3E78_04315 [Alphaproteobacteria bacterium RIFCSPHIGHO2_12_FULL_63_12]